jgi:hypothetical protein
VVKTIMEKDEIRVRIHEMIQTGRVPCATDDQVWAGRSIGTHCAACVEPIASSDMEFEVLVGTTTLRFHRSCYAIWREECESSAQPR